jgi:toxin HigB-1
MIRSFRHKALRQLFEADSRKGLNADQVERIRGILARLDASETIEGMNVPSYRLHALKGDRAGEWAVTVRANWRITFRHENGDAFDVDLVDYH